MQLCCEHTEPPDKNLVVLAAVLAASKNKKFCISVALCALTAVTLPYIITVRLHSRDANISLLREEMGKEMGP